LVAIDGVCVLYTNLETMLAFGALAAALGCHLAACTPLIPSAPYDSPQAYPTTHQRQAVLVNAYDVPAFHPPDKMLAQFCPQLDCFGEPLNVIISGKSDPYVRSDKVRCSLKRSA
jgi:hypothetical protein